MTPQKSNILPLPAIAVGVALLGGAMFVIGRNTAPSPQVAPVTEESPPSNAAHTEGAHSEEASHDEGEEGHGDEHGEHEHGAEEAIVFSPQALKSANIAIATILPTPQISGLPFNGEIEVSPDNIARVASLVPGRITRLYVTIGQRVAKGQTLALVESRSVGEAQSAYAQAVARLKNARSNYDVTLKQARAGVFSRGPLEVARRAQVEARSDARAQETAVRQARAALDNVTRLAKVGNYARPSLEAARSQYATARESLQVAQAAQENALASVRAAQAELARRRQVAQNGGYNSRPVEEARRVLVAAQSAKATAGSEVATTRANLARATSLHAEGLVSTRDLEAAQTAFETATARLQTATTDETTASQELERQQKLATSGVAGNAEISEAGSRLALAQADEKTRRAEVTRAREGVRLSLIALNRENAIFGGNIANRREFSQARSALENAQNALDKARQTAVLAEAAYQRELRIYRQNLNTTVQLQSVRAGLVSAQSDLEAARTTLSLLKSAPGGSAVVPIRAPLAGIVQMRDVAQGEVIDADKNLLTLVNLASVHVDMHLPERDIARIRIGAPVSIRVEAMPGRSFNGSVELIHSELDPKLRTLEAHAEIPNPTTEDGYLLRPGMFARGTIGSGAKSLALMVPADAVQDLEGKKVVFVAGEKTGEFQAQEVETGATVGGKTHIKSGLVSGAKIVVKGAFIVKAQAMKAELGHEH